jgi:hypothetical protein
MAFLTYADRVAETTTTTGTGTIQLAGAVDAKFRTFVAGVGSGATVPYVVVHRTANEWEVGYGVVTAGSPNTLTRAGIYSSSNSNNAVNLSTGTKDVFLSLPGSKTVRFDDATGGVTIASNVGIGTATTSTTLGRNITINGGSAGTNTGIVLQTAGTERGLLYGSDAQVVFGSSTNVPAVFITNNTERARIDASGNLIVPGVYSATVGGTNRDVFVDDTGLIGYVSSIRASKMDIAPVEDTDWLLQLEPVSFHYRKKDENGYTDEPDGAKEYGLIAEDVESVKPELCFYDIVDGEPKLRGISYSKLVTPLLALVKQQQARLDALEARLAALEGE